MQFFKTVQLFTIFSIVLVKGQPFQEDESLRTNEVQRNASSGDFVPQFMLDLYNVVADEYGESRNGAPNLGKTVNCIFAEESSMSPSPGKFYYRFNLSSVKNHEDLKRVELRVFKTKATDVRQKGKRFYRTDVSFITDTFQETRATMVSSAGYGWLPFDVTRIAKRYFKHKDQFLDIEISIQPIRDQLPTFRFLTATNTSTRALLILYSDTELNLNFNDHSPFTPTTTLSPVALKKIGEESFFKFLLKNTENGVKTRERRGIGIQNRFNALRPCRRRGLTIHFADHIEFRDVIAPQKINIYRCSGTCMNYISHGSGLEETNHARLQKLVYWFNVYQNPTISTNKRMPCCAPKKLTGLTLLFKRPQTANIYMTELKQAIVSECWCT